MFPISLWFVPIALRCFTSLPPLLAPSPERAKAKAACVCLCGCVFVGVCLWWGGELGTRRLTCFSLGSRWSLVCGSRVAPSCAFVLYDARGVAGRGGAFGEVPAELPPARGLVTGAGGVGGGPRSTHRVLCPPRGRTGWPRRHRCCGQERPPGCGRLIGPAGYLGIPQAPRATLALGLQWAFAFGARTHVAPKEAPKANERKPQWIYNAGLLEV